MKLPFVIPCLEIKGDTLEIVDRPDWESVRACVVTCYNATQGRHESIALNAESARQLFNWLGVWLHKQ